MSSTPYIPIVLGTAREGRKSESVARFIHERLTMRDDMEVTLIDVRNHIYDRTLPAWEDHEETEEWKSIAEKADGFIIVTPEYNHGYPGELKQFLDGAYDEYAHKPVALAGVSSGNFGGARVVDLIKPILVELKLMPIRATLYFPNVGELLDDEGDIVTEKRKEHEERVNQVTDTLLSYAKGMRSVRDELTSEK